MSMQALNLLLGRSTIDPSIEQAFVEGRIGDLLAAYGFAPELRAALGELKAETFREFASLAYQAVSGIVGAGAQDGVPSPLEGLIYGQLARADEQAA